MFSESKPYLGCQMLNDFWKLNSPHTPVNQPEEFERMLKTSKHVCNVQYCPPILDLTSNHPKKMICNTKFENVSFSKTEISKIHFMNCEFMDCLFVGTIFKKCRFIDCKFRNVNMSYCKFEDTFIHPDYLRNVFPSHSFSNIAIQFFQSVYNNFKDSNQPELLRTAEYYFMKWNLIHVFVDVLASMIKPKFTFFQMKIKRVFLQASKTGKASLGEPPEAFNAVNM